MGKIITVKWEYVAKVLKANRENEVSSKGVLMTVGMPGIVNFQGVHQQFVNLGLFIKFRPDWEHYVLLCCPAHASHLAAVSAATNILEWHVSELGLICINLQYLPQLHQWLGQRGSGQHNGHQISQANAVIPFTVTVSGGTAHPSRSRLGGVSA